MARIFLKRARYSIFVGVLFLIIFGVYPTSRILIGIPKNGEESICVWQDEQLILKWRHSVEKQYWQEVYHIHRHQLHLLHTYIQAFGAGTPVTGERIAAPAGYIGLKSNVYLKELEWMVSRNMEGVMISKQGEWHIYQLVPDYTSIHISVKKMPQIMWLWKEGCL